MPAFVNSRFGESGMSDEDGTMLCAFDLKKSKNDWRICELVVIRAREDKESQAARRVEVFVTECATGKTNFHSR